MKSFLLKGKSPICKWGMIPDETYFLGLIPEGYSLAINPNYPYIILDIDTNEKKCGFFNIPFKIQIELSEHFAYQTNSGGQHIWIKYSGNKNLLNKTSNLGIDLRTNKGYVKWYLDNDIRNYIYLIKPSSNELNLWLEQLFSNTD